MTDFKNISDDEMFEEEEERYTFTPWGCLYVTLQDYGFNVDNITPKAGEHMINDLMELMMKCGYVGNAG